MLITFLTLRPINSRMRQISREEGGESLRRGMKTRHLLCSQDVFCDARQTCGACQKLLEDTISCEHKVETQSAGVCCTNRIDWSPIWRSHVSRKRICAVATLARAISDSVCVC